ncbi:hypothetical protein LTR62_007305 [Meristemomyces frigidus]|uniref:Flavoprotein domain-containing protein n=1 Tax=Meristemomyces frigidus TaxID=1508187 RepID=A0AAN7YRG3_9PEZI|nr:hypothetical protein LTR62_007305 [Meristemomyces frigidus]
MTRTYLQKAPRNQRNDRGGRTCGIKTFFEASYQDSNILDAKVKMNSPLVAADHINDGKHHLLLAATGSVATIKIPNIIEALSPHENLSIRILLSESVANFLQGQSAEQPSLAMIDCMQNVDGIYSDADEWRKPWVRGDSILHIELRRWADLMVIAPLSANSLAKIAKGMSDNLLTSVVRAWDTTGLIDLARPGIPLPCGGKKIIVVAPAMNTAMWHHPVTAEHIQRLEKGWGLESGGWFVVLRPMEKELACGDVGSGAMQDWKMIVHTVEHQLHLGG